MTLPPTTKTTTRGTRIPPRVRPVREETSISTDQCTRSPPTRTATSTRWGTAASRPNWIRRICSTPRKRHERGKAKESIPSPRPRHPPSARVAIARSSRYRNSTTPKYPFAAHSRRLRHIRPPISQQTSDRPTTKASNAAIHSRSLPPNVKCLSPGTRRMPRARHGTHAMAPATSTPPSAILLPSQTTTTL